MTKQTRANAHSATTNWADALNDTQDLPPAESMFEDLESSSQGTVTPTVESRPPANAHPLLRWCQAVRSKADPHGSVILHSDQLNELEEMAKAIVQKEQEETTYRSSVSARFDKMDQVLLKLTTTPPNPITPTGHIPPARSWADIAASSQARLAKTPQRVVLQPPPNRILNEFKLSSFIIQKPLNVDPFRGLPPSQICGKINTALAAIDAKNGELDLRVSTAAVLPSVHSCPASFDPENETHVFKLCTSSKVRRTELDSIRWLVKPTGRSTHGSLLVYFTNKSLATKIENANMIYENQLLRGARFIKQAPQCFNCLKMGHIAARCKDNPLCANCGQTDHNRLGCDIEESEDFCWLCVQQADNEGHIDLENSRFRHNHRSAHCPEKAKWLSASARISSKLNCHNKKEASWALFHDSPISTIALLLQEPWINPLTLSPPAHKDWLLITGYNHTPKDYHDKHRACIYIRRQIPSADISILPGDKFLAAATITLGEKLLTLLSVYNPPKTNQGLPILKAWLRDHYSRKEPTVIGMDANLHHRRWNPPRYTYQDSSARELNQMCGNKNLTIVSPLHVATHHSKGSATTIDLTWANSTGAKLLMGVEVLHENFNSDHQAIQINLSLGQSALPPQEYRSNISLDKLDIEAFVERLRKTIVPPVSPPSSAREVDDLVQSLTTLIYQAFHNQGKLVRQTSAKKKPWWDTAILNPLRDNRNQARKWLLRAGSYDALLCYRHHQQIFKDEVLRLKRSHWRSFLADADRNRTFTAYSYVKAQTQDAILPLRRMDGSFATNKPEQATILFEGTSVVHNPCNLEDVSLSPFEPPHIFPPITSSYFPRQWRRATTVIIRKQGKPDYTEANAYRPIALLCSLGKLFEKIINDRLTFWAGSTQAIPPNHFGGCRGRSIEDAYLLLTTWIHQKWENRKTVTGLFLDVQSAYPAVNTTRLLAILQRKNCPTYIVGLVAGFLSERSTIMRLGDYLSEPMEITGGLPQGSPLSVSLYLLYNSALLELTSTCLDSDQISLGFIDDVSLFTAHKSPEQAIKKLESLGTKALDWGIKHGAKFDIKKSQLMIFTKARSPPNLTITFGDRNLSPQATAKWLGIQLDRKLLFKDHYLTIKKKGNHTLAQLRRLSPTFHGLRGSEIFKITRAVLVPRILLGSLIWYNSRNPATVEKILNTLTNGARRLVGGALYGTPNSVLAAQQVFPDLATLAKKMQHTYLLRKTSTFPDEPIANLIRNYCTDTPPARRAPLALLLDRDFFLQCHKPGTEQILQNTTPPWVKSTTHSLHLNLCKTEAIDYMATFCEEQNRNNIIYTDGSSIPGKGVGAAAHTPWGQTAQFYLGSQDHFTNNLAEILAISMGLQLITDHRTRESTDNHFFICSDSKAAIRSICNPHFTGQGQFAVRHVQQQLQSFKTDTRVTLVWCPGHSKIEGNEQADVLAKQAATDKKTTITLDCPLAWSIAPSFLHIARQFQTRPSYNCAKQRNMGSLLMEIEKGHGAIIRQLSSGYVPLNHHLFKIHSSSVSSPRCPFCPATETVTHMILYCHKYRKSRASLRHTLQKEKLKIDRFSTKGLLEDTRVIPHLLKFLLRSARFPHLTKDRTSHDTEEMEKEG